MKWATKFRKRQVVIEAIQYNGHNCSEIHKVPGLTMGNVIESPVLERTLDNPTGEYLQIRTPDGFMAAVVGDWIIKGVKGEVYPCKPDIFDLTYEPVGDQDNSVESIDHQELIRDTVIANIAKACPEMLNKDALSLADKILRDESAQGVVVQTGVLKVCPDRNLTKPVNFPVVNPLVRVRYDT